MKDVEEINCFLVSGRFNQCFSSSTFKFFMESFPLYFLDIYRQPSQNQVNLLVKIFCFETETPFKKHVFWSKKFVV